MPAERESIEARDIEHLIHPYTNLVVHREKGPFVLERGEGIYVWDRAGRRYIEGLAGLWCTALGFGEEALARAAFDQMKRLPYYHLFGGKSQGPAVELAEKLKEIAPFPASKVFFVNSGSEANDTLIKLVWYINNALGRPQKKKIISRRRAYHGVTIAAGSLTGLPFAQQDFDLPIPGILHTDCPHYYREARPGETEEDFADRLAQNLENLILDQGPETVAAFIAEPVMGAGGVIVPPRTYFEKVQAILKRYDILFLDDEVICGFGRTGNLFGCQTYDFTPDAMTVAKALSSAYLPVGAVLIPESMYDALLDESRKLGTFGHGFTYSGHPVCAAVALRNIQLMEERRILDHVRLVSGRFQERLASLGRHPLVGETRGVGLVGGCELVADKETRRPFEPARAVGAFCAERALSHGLITRNLGDTLAFCPPLIITEEEIDDLFDRFERALEETERWVEEKGLTETQ
ncbi:MAG: aspartate aminotransferase family protein [Deltaproteobacteria bacterium]|nr:aspartate aminotransferase family protein [Deltaproteobacteria bacterium]MBW2103581.1 aspartate aminotransferase family protein [Deltaproteobacteria bacterium]